MTAHNENYTKWRKKMAGIKPKHHHSDRDKIFTPENVVKKLIKKIPSKDEDSWCDCCYGKGVFYNNFPCIKEQKDFFEIDMGKDFLISNNKFDWIVTNIPFSKPKEFIFKMAENCNKGFGILCLANSMTATRLIKLEEMGLYLHSITILYIKDWGFGYRTDFYVFTRNKVENIDIIVNEKTKKCNLDCELAHEEYCTGKVWGFNPSECKAKKNEDLVEIDEDFGI